MAAAGCRQMPEQDFQLGGKVRRMQVNVRLPEFRRGAESGQGFRMSRNGVRHLYCKSTLGARWVLWMPAKKLRSVAARLVRPGRSWEELLRFNHRYDSWQHRQEGCVLPGL